MLKYHKQTQRNYVLSTVKLTYAGYAAHDMYRCLEVTAHQRFPSAASPHAPGPLAFVLTCGYSTARWDSCGFVLPRRHASVDTLDPAAAVLRGTVASWLRMNDDTPRTLVCTVVCALRFSRPLASMPWREVASASFLGCAGGCLRVADAEGRRADEGAADMSSLHVQCPQVEGTQLSTGCLLVWQRV